MSVVIAVPLSIFAINRWLASFAYHIQVGWIVFPVAAVAALLVAWLTVGYESMRAATANPTKALRAE
ncbi:MAG TPA: hypothetical protein VMH27_20255 [Puia sp.]|nr:hypothetical protein [Puia sp.]